MPMLKRYTALKRSGPLRRKKPINRRSIAKINADRKYAVLRVEHLREHPVCEVWCTENGYEWLSPRRYRMIGYDSDLSFSAEYLIVAMRAPHATTIHHRNKRRGKMLNNRDFFLACSFANHRRIEDSLSWARKMGFSENF